MIDLESIDLQPKIKSLTKGISRLERKQLPAAINHSINRTMKTVNSQELKRLAKDTGLKQKVIKDGVTVIKSNFQTLQSKLIVKDRYRNLKTFNGRQAKAGVRARAWGVPKVYAGSFLGNQDRTAFARTSKERLPIRPLVGPNPAVEAERDDDFKSILATKRFNEIFPRELKFRFSKVKFK